VAFQRKLSPPVLREFIINIGMDYNAGMTVRQIAAKYEESYAFTHRWLQHNPNVTMRKGGRLLGKSRRQDPVRALGSEHGRDGPGTVQRLEPSVGGRELLG
jgi:hypothetical protein